MDRFKTGDIIQDKYQVTRVLGEGGMGFVLEAYQKDLDRRVALKFLLPSLLDRPQLAQRFAREAIAGSKIKNEHVAVIYDVDRVEGMPFIVMELLVGEDLASLIDRQAPLAHAAAVDLVLQAAEGINAAHAVGIVHRDLKPQNLFLTTAPDGERCVKVLDLGISKASFNDRLAITSMSDVIGTPAYMSPEQLRVSRDVDVRTDVWSLGVILYEALCDERPFAGSSFLELYTAILTGKYTKASERESTVPAEMDAVFAETFTLDRADRIPTIEAFAARLVPFGTGAGRASYERIRRLAARRSAPPRDVHLEESPPGIAELEVREPTDEATTVDPPRARRLAPLAVIGGLAAVGAMGGIVYAARAPSPALSASPASDVIAAASTPVVSPISAATTSGTIPEVAPPTVSTASPPEPPPASGSSSRLAACSEGSTAACIAACKALRTGGCFDMAKTLEKDGKDLARTAAIYQLECDRAHFPACGRLAPLYASGRGVARDKAQAVNLYQLACTGGDGSACVSVGTMYTEGDGVPKNEDLGARYLRTGCNKGDQRGCLKLREQGP